jgi:hypothetical protein
METQVEPKTNVELLTLVLELAREKVDVTKAFRQVRNEGGRDLFKDDTQFGEVYDRFQRHPLFAAQMVLNAKRSAFGDALCDAVYTIAPADDAECDVLCDAVAAFGKGSADAMLRLIDTVTVNSPELGATLSTTARALHPRLFSELDKYTAPPSAQLELPLEPVAIQPVAVPAVP